MRGGQTRRERAQLRRRFAHTRSVLQPPHRPESPPVTVRFVGRIERKRQPHAHPTQHGRFDGWVHDADDLIRFVVEREETPDNRRILSELVRPHAMAECDHAMLSRRQIAPVGKTTQ
jgi:hypothetical protein